MLFRSRLGFSGTPSDLLRQPWQPWHAGSRGEPSSQQRDAAVAATEVAVGGCECVAVTRVASSGIGQRAAPYVVCQAKAFECACRCDVVVE